MGSSLRRPFQRPSVEEAVNDTGRKCRPSSNRVNWPLQCMAGASICSFRIPSQGSAGCLGRGHPVSGSAQEVGRPVISMIQPADYPSCSNPPTPVDAETVSYVPTGGNLSALLPRWRLSSFDRNFPCALRLCLLNRRSQPAANARSVVELEGQLPSSLV